MSRLASKERNGSKPEIVVAKIDPRELMSVAHKHINVLSGTMVLAFKSGPSRADFHAWADKLRMVADQLDAGAVEC